MIPWAGRILVLLGGGHFVAAYVLTWSRHAVVWFGADLWSPQEGVLEMSPAMAAFWLTTGSCGLPLAVIGLIVLWLHRRQIVPPSFIPWALGLWSLIAAVILGPSPFVLGLVAAGLLFAGGRRSGPHVPRANRTPKLGPSSADKVLKRN